MAALAQKGSHRDPTIMTAEKALEMATIDGARAIGLEDFDRFDRGFGEEADIAIVGTNHPAMAPVHNPVSALVYSALGHEVTDVFIDGRPVMRNGRITTVNESAVLATSRLAADALARRWGAIGSRRGRGAPLPIRVQRKPASAQKTARRAQSAEIAPHNSAARWPRTGAEQFR